MYIYTHISWKINKVLSKSFILSQQVFYLIWKLETNVGTKEWYKIIRGKRKSWPHAFLFFFFFFFVNCNEAMVIFYRTIKVNKLLYIMCFCCIIHIELDESWQKPRGEGITATATTINDSKFNTVLISKRSNYISIEGYFGKLANTYFFNIKVGNWTVKKSFWFSIFVVSLLSNVVSLPNLLRKIQSLRER